MFLNYGYVQPLPLCLVLQSTKGGAVGGTRETQSPGPRPRRSAPSAASPSPEPGLCIDTCRTLTSTYHRALSVRFVVVCIVLATHLWATNPSIMVVWLASVLWKRRDRWTTIYLFQVIMVWVMLWWNWLVNTSSWRCGKMKVSNPNSREHNGFWPENTQISKNRRNQTECFLCMIHQ